MAIVRRIERVSFSRTTITTVKTNSNSRLRNWQTALLPPPTAGHLPPRPTSAVNHREKPRSASVQPTPPRRRIPPPPPLLIDELCMGPLVLAKKSHCNCTKFLVSFITDQLKSRRKVWPAHTRIISIDSTKPVCYMRDRTFDGQSIRGYTLMHTPEAVQDNEQDAV
ncbi:hypothetical protein TcasGA2_TC012021 [Tribolium castaneum]|uniref:Uncharacterized protein n=1 Tax=Tribolium castaneum TaxID=7070 RepID=D6X2D9_TRICA|nr:hypothetical protein TcasGA2_TC012021 [Tribolium castaneum]